MLYVILFTNLLWTWYVLVGTLVTIAGGSLASLPDHSQPQRDAPPG
jgi:hypothetical protein